MRFERLQIPAFGPFTDLDLRFASDPGDLHVIYGFNEAGKSSLLRAVGDLLFGIPGQSPDGFLHDYGALRIRGTILNRAGRAFEFQRRKGNKNTLLDSASQPLPDAALLPFLGGVNRSYFSAMFGLGAKELREGAQQILRGEGDIGTALFSASLGGTPIQKVVEALEAEADRLFKGRSTVNVSIRPACNRYRDLLRESRDAMVDPEKWGRMEEDLAQAEAAQRGLEEQIANLDQSVQWLTRCEDALPTIGRLKEKERELTQLAGLPELASDFIPRTRAARKAVADAQLEIQRLGAQIGRLESRLAECRVVPGVLDQADRLDQLHQDLGGYRDRKKALATLEISLAGLESGLRAGMESLQLGGGLDELSSFRVSSPVRLAFEEAARALDAALAAQTANSNEIGGIEHRIRTQNRQLQSLPEADLTDLREALAVAAEATEADRTFSTAEAEVQRLRRVTAEQHRLVSGAPEGFEATAALAVPTLATMRRYHEELEGIQRDLQAEQKKLDEVEQQAAATQAALDRLQRHGNLPSEEALRQARAHRDHGWELVLAEWKGAGAEEELVPGSPLEKAFPEAVAQADAVADQLRSHAGAIAQMEEKRFQLGEAKHRAALARQRLSDLQVLRDVRQQAWQSEWSASRITPRSPLEMEEWRREWTEFRERLAQLEHAQESLERKGRQIDQAKKRIASALVQSAGKEFSLLFAEARKRVQDGEQSAGQRVQIGKQLEALQGEFAQRREKEAHLADAVTLARENWERRCREVGLPPTTSPESGLNLLRERMDLLSRFDEWRRQTRQSEAMAEGIARYENAVSQIATALGAPSETVETAESALWQALTKAREAQARQAQLSEEIQRVMGEREAAQLNEAASQTALRHLVQVAGLDSADALEPFLSRLEQRLELRSQIETLGNPLRGLARGQPVNDFVARVQAEDADTLGHRKSVALDDKARLEATLRGVRETAFGLREQKRSLEKAGDAAADLRQQAELCAAALKRDAARFVRLRLAAGLLEAQIERFRKENQGPLLEQSGTVFRALTLGAFTGLIAEFNADDLPILMGVRPDQTKVSVEGMSDGTRDQLYLALRLAALDRYLQEHEPMPLILDDLLVTFDNPRAGAVLPQLSALAQRTQILLFTHHEHLVGLCRQTLGEGQFHLHHLNSRT